jgi:hypothetical protein
VNLFGLDRWEIVDGFERALVVEPVHVVECFDLDVFDPTWLTDRGLMDRRAAELGVCGGVR